jgi:hypothetical protein
MSGRIGALAAAIEPQSNRSNFIEARGRAVMTPAAGRFSTLAAADVPGVQRVSFLLRIQARTQFPLALRRQ